MANRMDSASPIGLLTEAYDIFSILGGHIPKKATTGAEIQHRICCASTSFRKLRNRLFDNHNPRKGGLHTDVT